jgi:hypothetical protein
MSEPIREATHDEVVRATQVVTGRPVVSCPSVGDAAAPVIRHQGGSTRQVGQAADYRHAATASRSPW